MPTEPSERDDLKEFLTEVRETVCADVLGAADRFPNGDALVAKLDAAVDRLFERGWDHLNEVNEGNTKQHLRKHDSPRTRGWY